MLEMFRIHFRRPLEKKMEEEEEEEQENRGREVCSDVIHSRNRVWSLVLSRKKALSPSLFPPFPCAHKSPIRRGYVGGLSGLLTGLPPFIIAGSLVLLLGATAALGTVSPTSCNDGSLYIATEGADKEEEKGRERKNLLSNIYTSHSQLFPLYCPETFIFPTSLKS